MRKASGLGLLALLLAVTAAAQGPEPPSLRGDRGMLVPRGVIDMRAELPEQFRVLQPEAPQVIHPPVGPTGERAGEVPGAPPGEGAREALLPEVVPAPLVPSPPLAANFPALPDNLAVIPPDTF